MTMMSHRMKRRMNKISAKFADYHGHLLSNTAQSSIHIDEFTLGMKKNTLFVTLIVLWYIIIIS